MVNLAGILAWTVRGCSTSPSIQLQEACLNKWLNKARTKILGSLITSPNDEDDLFDESELCTEALSVQVKRFSSQASGLVRKKEIASRLFEI